MENIQIATFESCTSLKFGGRVDAYQARFLKTAFNDLLDNKHFRLIFDLSEVTFLSSKGIGVLVEVFTTCKANGGRLVVSEAMMEIQNSFEIAGIQEYLEVYDDLKAAVASFS